MFMRKIEEGTNSQSTPTSRLLPFLNLKPLKTLSPAMSPTLLLASTILYGLASTSTALLPPDPLLPSAASAATSAVRLTPNVLGSFHFLPSKAELELAFRLFFASLTGSLIGFERSQSDRPAGIRTMALVSLGAASFTLCSLYGFIDKYDTSRMASNVASGVGFIGAGVITNNRKSNGVYDKTSSVRGLTTASAIWVSAAVGVCAGAGLYFISFIAAVGTITILRVGKWRGVIDDLKDLKDFKLEMAAREEIKEKEMREKKKEKVEEHIMNIVGEKSKDASKGKDVSNSGTSTTSDSSLSVIVPPSPLHPLPRQPVVFDDFINEGQYVPPVQSPRVKIVDPLLTRHLKQKQVGERKKSKKRYESVESKVLKAKKNSPEK
ncbi:hypothetical protein TrVE_jg7300 [Triparma verrucosa]|uniref:MgtC/SapB/SrpB/YhiD N-terminal domain-containing protein n=1 Tax=Triparma verrucosa TaxID=1606542 RepID=A0A9W7CA28_9STRA|nr:hypothetical protein TrVE_jg7300 [Triparma verrucosa]